MIEHLFAAIAGAIMTVIQSLGLGGVALLMAIESACIPLPSEVIMPFAGFLVSRGVMDLWLVSLAGAIGCVLGSVVAYYVGAWGGRPLVERYGKYILVSRHDLEIADRFFLRWGSLAVLIARLLPVVRTFIAFPAGIARMRMLPFLVYTFVGSFIWSLGLAWVGVLLGSNWQSLRIYFHRFDALIAAALLAGVVWWVWRHVRSAREVPDDSPDGPRAA